MSARLIKIDKDNLNLAWPDAMPYIEKALVLTPEYTVQDVWHLLKIGEITLWMFYNEKKKRAFGAMTTQIVEQPQKRTLHIFLLSADNFEDVKPLFPEFMEYARQIGAKDIECGGRFGLEKLLENMGFKKSYIVMSIDVN